MTALAMVAEGGEKLVALLEKKQAQVEANQSRAERAAANTLKKVMQAEAPYTATSVRDVTRKKAKVKHLRATIRVRHTASGQWAVGPASPLAHLVVRGASRGQTERVGGSGGQVHQVTLAGRRQLRAHARGIVGPAGEARALAITSGGQTFFRASAKPGPMPANNFIQRTLEIARGEATHEAGNVLFRGATVTEA
jgi:hypothetical protein